MRNSEAIASGKTNITVAYKAIINQYGIRYKIIFRKRKKTNMALGSICAAFVTVSVCCQLLKPLDGPAFLLQRSAGPLLPAKSGQLSMFSTPYGRPST